MLRPLRAFAFALLLPALAQPLGAACSCTVNASVSGTTLNVSGTSTGSCSSLTEVRFATGIGSWGPPVQCFSSTSCTATASWSTSCLSTGEHVVRALCSCGQAGTSSSGSPTCSNSWSDAVATYSVYTTPSIGLSVSGPDNTGRVQFSMPFAFPNTISHASRDLYLNIDGMTRMTASSDTVSGTWAPSRDMSCWDQGVHDLRAVAIACDKGDPSYRADAFGSVTIDHEPQVSLSLAPAPGGAQAQVGYSVPQTNYATQRPGAELFYQAGGVGNPANPGEAAWKPTLGRNWSHDYAERLVPLSSGSVVWLITRYGTFRKFDLYRSATGLYDRVSPTDETRKLKKTSTGWELRELDGTVQVFNSTGLWQSTRDRFGNSSAPTATPLLGIS